MSEFDLHSNIDDRVALVFTGSAGALTNGAVIDTGGDEGVFQSIEFIAQSHTITSGDFAILLEESDDAGFSIDVTAVSEDETLGSLTGFVAADDDTTIRVGSIGKKRYQRMSLVGTNTPVGEFSAIAILGHPHTAPVAQ